MSNWEPIKVEGERELFLKMQRTMQVHTDTGRTALRKGAMNIINDAKQNLRDNGSIATGQLRASGKVQAVEGEPDAVEAGFFSEHIGNGYAAVVEFGSKGGGKRRLGFMIRIIKQWLKKKGTPADELADKSFFIARSIIKKGTQPHPYLTPAVEKNKDAIIKEVQDAIAKEINNGK